MGIRAALLSWGVVLGSYGIAQLTQRPEISDIGHTVMGVALKETADFIPFGKYKRVAEIVSIILGNYGFQHLKAGGVFWFIPGLNDNFYSYKVLEGIAGGGIAMTYDMNSERRIKLEKNQMLRERK